MKIQFYLYILILFLVSNESLAQLRHSRGVKDISIYIGAIPSQLKGYTTGINFSIHQPYKKKNLQLWIGAHFEDFNFLVDVDRSIYDRSTNDLANPILVSDSISEQLSVRNKAIYGQIGVKYLIKDFSDHLYLHFFSGIRGGMEDIGIRQFQTGLLGGFDLDVYLSPQLAISTNIRIDYLFVSSVDLRFQSNIGFKYALN